MTETPFLLRKPLRQKAAVVLTSPHSGRQYGADFLAASRLDATAIRRSEDSFVDDLFAAGPELGVPLLAATVSARLLRCEPRAVGARPRDVRR